MSLFARVLALSMAMWFAVDAPEGLAIEFGLYERTGGFVLELDTHAGDAD